MRRIEFGNSRAATVIGFVHFFVMLLTLTIYANLVQITASLPQGGGRSRRLALADVPPRDAALEPAGRRRRRLPTFVLAIGDYITPQILGGNRELLLPQAIMLQIGRRADFPMAAALQLILMLVVSAAYLPVRPASEDGAGVRAS